MSVFVISNVDVKNPEKMKEYATAAGQSLAAIGATVAMRGTHEKTVGEPLGSPMVGIMEFPDLAAFDAWYASDAYQALIPIRNEACDVSLTVYSAM